MLKKCGIYALTMGVRDIMALSHQFVEYITDE